MFKKILDVIGRLIRILAFPIAVFFLLVIGIFGFSDMKPPLSFIIVFGIPIGLAFLLYLKVKKQDQCPNCKKNWSITQTGNYDIVSSIRIMKKDSNGKLVPYLKQQLDIEYRCSACGHTLRRIESHEEKA